MGEGAPRKQHMELEIHVELPGDENGYLDRRCHHDECGRAFKISEADWERVPEDGTLWCPFCRHKADREEWHTPEQIEFIQAQIDLAVQDYVDGVLRDHVRDFNQKFKTRRSSGLIDISMSASFQLGPRPLVVPLEAAELLKQEFVCDECNVRWASLGASYCCPGCGHTSVEREFGRTLSRIEQIIASEDRVQSLFQNDDDAVDAIQHIREDQLSRVVGAFEKAAEHLYASISGSQPKRGLFQRINDSSEAWGALVGRSYEDILGGVMYNRLKVLVQRRHLLVHKLGIVDQRYIEQTGDLVYSIGQRVTVAPDDVLELVGIARSLIDDLSGRYQEPS